MHLPPIFLAIICSSAAFLMGACSSGRPVKGALLEVARGGEGADIRSILVATNRTAAAEAGTFFEGGRNEEVCFHRLDISVPAAHKPGKIERPRRGAPDPAKHFANVGFTQLGSAEKFRADLARRVRSSTNKEIVIFIHGYNTLYAEAVLLAAQMAHDTQFGGVPLLFSWPSEGSLLGYVYDRDSVMASRDALDQTIRLAAESGARKVSVFAHSMGCLLTMETLRQAKLTGDATYGGRLQHVLLAAPDISIDVFKSQIKRLGPKPQLTVLLSRDDRALSFSRMLSGDVEKVGSFSDDATLAELGVTVVDLTNVESNDLTRHAKFAQMPGILTAIASHVVDNKMEQRSTEGTTSERLEVMGLQTVEIIITTPIRAVGRILDKVQGR